MINVEKTLSEAIDTDNWFSGDDLQKKLQKAILTLPEKQRIVFNLKYFEEMKYDEMAEVLGTSVGALKASYHHAVKKIEKYIGRIKPFIHSGVKDLEKRKMKDLNEIEPGINGQMKRTLLAYRKAILKAFLIVCRNACF